MNKVIMTIKLHHFQQKYAEREPGSCLFKRGLQRHDSFRERIPFAKEGGRLIIRLTIYE
jgi:hypothetical protein